ncbi:MAG: zf-HC2 domain-containing protein [Thermoanaerobaculia bacterium]|nr:zf-HC2 domain-containing protein [Thermoanaerobaculia bacterium]
MTTTCQSGFDEVLLSGYIDGELAQGERQRIDVHVDQCAHCSSLLSSLRDVRDIARGTAFKVPSDEMWRETARTPPSRWLRQIGWIITSLFAVALTSIVTYEVVTSPEPWWVRLTVFAALSGVGLLFVSVLMDRLHDRHHDRYRRVLK